MSPSTLSRSIQRLESEIGHKLFERSKRSVRLTYAGERFLDFAKDSLASWNKLLADVSPDSASTLGEISLYCSVTASYTVLPDLLGKIRRTFPKVTISLETGDPELALEKVRSGTAQLSIAPQPEIVPSDLQMKQVMSTQLVAVQRVRNSKRASARTPIWSEMPLILPQEGVARSLIERWFVTQRIDPRIYGRVAGNEAILALVASGCGLGIVPKVVLDRSYFIKQLSILRVRPGLPNLGIALCMRRGEPSSTVVSKLWEQLTG